MDKLGFWNKREDIIGLLDWEEFGNLKSANKQRCKVAGGQRGHYSQGFWVYIEKMKIIFGRLGRI